MIKRIATFVVAGAIVVAAMVLSACETDENYQSPTAKLQNQLDPEVVASIEFDSTVENCDDSVTPEVYVSVESAINALDLIAVEENPQDRVIVNDIMVEGSKVYAAHAGGLLIYNMKDNTSKNLEATGGISVLARHSGEMFAGGDQLYLVTGESLMLAGGDFKGHIQALLTYGPSLMVGTSAGLFAQNVLGTIPLMEEITVSALASDDRGLWIGTDGEGLFYWDGEDYSQRYLDRDPTLFDFVTTMDSRRGYLYLGTTRGLFVHDGGSWRQMTVENGLPSDFVTSIDASGWTVFVGTAEGLASLHQGVIAPAGKLANEPITTVVRDGNKLFAGATTRGLVLQSGPVLRTLVKSLDAFDELASIAH